MRIRACMLASLLLLCVMASRAGGSPFAIRGIKGLWWEGIAKYRQAVPWLSEHDLNFLMLCYTSFPASGKDWRADYTPQEKRQIADLTRDARTRGITVCLSFNPGIWSDPPLSYSSDADYAAAWGKVKGMHALGLTWFGLCLDDINKALTPEDAARFGTLQAAQVHFVNRLWHDMRGLRPRAHLIFCPSAYTTGEAKAHLDYTRAIGQGIDRGVMFFWTGPEVCSATITAADAREIAALYRRKPFVWDNYPVNDMFPWRPLLAPVRGRDAALAGEVSGYMANPMRQWTLSTLPLATLAAYLNRPAAYDPAAALEAAIREYPAEDQSAIRLLAELYGSSFWGQNDFPPRPDVPAPASPAMRLARYRALRRALSSRPALRPIWEDARETIEADIATLEKLSRSDGLKSISE